ncbi:MAG: dihydrodipicolinate reductase C-terminal domain-containing protein [Balneola sp.]
MKISVIGTGKTGSKVVELLGDKLLYAFDENNPPTLEKLKESDALIIFIPGDAVPKIFGLVLESGVPTAWGSTGFNWPSDLNEQVKAYQTKWILATNFSLGMNIIRHTIKKISEGSDLLKDPKFKIHEIHHIHKKDAPSGTALSWKEWLGREAEITSAREGDVNGIHELTLSTAREEITLTHNALDRTIFAEGAIWTAEQLVNNLTLTNGVHTFGELFDQVIKEK